MGARTIERSTCRSPMGARTNERSACRSPMGARTIERSKCRSPMGAPTIERSTCRSPMGAPTIERSACRSPMGARTNERSACRYPIGGACNRARDATTRGSSVLDRARNTCARAPRMPDRAGHRVVRDLVPPEGRHLPDQARSKRSQSRSPLLVVGKPLANRIPKRAVVSGARPPHRVRPRSRTGASQEPRWMTRQLMRRAPFASQLPHLFFCSRTTMLGFSMRRRQQTSTRRSSEPHRIRSR